MGRTRTRIIATLGPASGEPTTLRRMIAAGVDVVRLNFSHGSHDVHRDLFEMVHDVSEQMGEPVAVLQDLSGPKMRVGLLKDGQSDLASGSSIIVQESGGVGEANRIVVEAAGALGNLERGQSILLADGVIELEVLDSTESGVACKVVHGGILRSRQGVHFPGARLPVGAMTEKDHADLAFGLELGVDAVALSFVRSADDIMTLRRVLDRAGKHPFVIAKIERAEALEHLDGILDVCSGVMVARGDLGVEMGVERVPLAQKRIIAEALRRHRPVITATQMLESMIERPSATRAEVSDVANAVLEGTDALMLSGETAIGKHPVEAVCTLAKVARQIESERNPPEVGNIGQLEDHTVAAARGARVMARAVQASVIVGFTNSGRTVRLLSSQRPTRKIVGVTFKPATVRRMKLFWGVTPLLVGEAKSVPEMLRDAEEGILEHNVAPRDSTAVVVCGEQVLTGATNTVKIHRVGRALDLLGKSKPGAEGQTAPRASRK